MKQTSKNSKGITLIALVITIIVLLILAGVTIATLTGDNGILNKAQSAKQTNNKGEIKEKVSLYLAEYRMEKGDPNKKDAIKPVAEWMIEKQYIEQKEDYYVLKGETRNKADGDIYVIEKETLKSAEVKELQKVATTVTSDVQNSIKVAEEETTEQNYVLNYYSEDGTAETLLRFSKEGLVLTVASTNPVEPTPPEEDKNISKTESYIGYYADVDDDGTIDGVIYADLANGENVEKKWNNNSYRIPKVEASELKEYKIKTAKFPDGVAKDVFKTGKTEEEVIVPVLEDNDLKDRFYVMTLADFNGSDYRWAYNEFGRNYQTGYGFEEGKYSTERLVEYWRENPAESVARYGWGTSESGQRENGIVGMNNYSGWDDSRILWNDIRDRAENGWFVPSEEEWVAFASELKISNKSSDDNYYSKLGLAKTYWSSSQSSGYYYNLRSYRYRRLLPIRSQGLS